MSTKSLSADLSTGKKRGRAGPHRNTSDARRKSSPVTYALSPYPGDQESKRGERQPPPAQEKKKSHFRPAKKEPSKAKARTNQKKKKGAGAPLGRGEGGKREGHCAI